MKKISLFALGLIVSANLFAQKANVTSAVLEYRNYNPMGGDMAKSKAALEKAKGFIDLAAEHPETKEDEKMFYYRGVIYYSLVECMSMDQTQKPDEAVVAKNFEIAKEYLTKAYTAPKGKFKADAQTFVDEKYAQIFNFALAGYNAKTYDMAAQLFLASYEIKQLLGQDSEDSRKNALICMANVVNEKIEKKEYDAAIEFVKPFKEAFPKEAEPLTSLANIYLQKGDNAAAEQVISEAIKNDPTNKVLYYYIGSIYMDLKNNEKAEENLAKALELDPNYLEAQYQLGAHLHNWSADIAAEINKLPFGDPKEAGLKEQMKEKRSKAVAVLEKYIEKDPTNKAVLQILFETHRGLGNKEKALEYKKRVDELK